MKGFFWMPFPPGPLLIGTLESRTAHVLLCFIIPILWNYYSPGVSLQLAKGDSRERTHDLQSPTYLLTLSSLWQPGVCVCVCASHSLCVCWFCFGFFLFVCLFVVIKPENPYFASRPWLVSQVALFHDPILGNRFLFCLCFAATLKLHQERQWHRWCAVIRKPGSAWLTVPTFSSVLSFFLSWVSKTQPNHWTKRMTSTWLAT